ncbi:hypothetical protein IAQ67_14850 [Paenibacillus peoriae]|uniref:Uncharacterized protein n=1 Tax=Paenibacillus peoriae TaxID=59893 RepID=A0A7H0Y285_9BACL|nr:hypothetical protein [Paenibacillus peoriae]QNR65193.1 hypothetical protein IAQ67_14850 [Paenibacillus peoriae]
MNKNKNDIIHVFEELSEAGNGVLAIPPQNEEEREERDRLMQEYLTKKRINLSFKTGTLK